MVERQHELDGSGSTTGRGGAPATRPRSPSSPNASSSVRPVRLGRRGRSARARRDGSAPSARAADRPGPRRAGAGGRARWRSPRRPARPGCSSSAAMQPASIRDTSARCEPGRPTEQMIDEVPNDRSELVMVLWAVADVRPNPLYDPRDDHDACGLGFVVRVSGEADHSTRRAGPRGPPQDGASRRHRRRSRDGRRRGPAAAAARRLPAPLGARGGRHRLPPPGEYAVAMCFLPRDPAQQLICEELLVRITHEEGQIPIGWRDVPVDSAHIGRPARESEPVIRQLFVTRGRGVSARRVRAQALRDPPPRRARASARAGRRVDLLDRELLEHDADLQGPASLAPSSARYYPDLQDPPSSRRSRSCTRASRRTRSAPGTSRSRSTTSRTTARSTPCAATARGCTRASRACARRCSATTSRSCSRSSTSAGPTRQRSTPRSSCS